MVHSAYSISARASTPLIMQSQGTVMHVAKVRKYTWRFECEKCHYKWKNDIPYYRHSGEITLFKCPQCGYVFYYREDYYYFDDEDELIMNLDDDEGI